MRRFKHSNRYIVSEVSVSPTVAAILAFVYRKSSFENYTGKQGQNVIEGLIELALVRKVSSIKGTFYFKTEKSENFKAVDFAKEYLWAFHNTSERAIKQGKRYIFCFDKNLPDGRGLVEIEEAIKKKYI